jgi:hypothetical protein
MAVMLRISRASLLAVLLAESLLAVLVPSGVSLPEPVIVGAELASLCVTALVTASAYGTFRAEIRDGVDRRTALRRTVDRLVPVQIRRLLVFELKGMASVALWVAGRRNGVPPGASALPYAREQTPVLLVLLFVMILEAVCTEVLLRGLGAPTGLRHLFLVLDVYSVFAVLAIWAARVTRPHVVTSDELRVRSGVFFDLRIPRRLISSVRLTRNYNERGLATVEEGRLAVPMSSQTTVVVEVTEPLTVVRPLGSRAQATTVCFFTDEPGAALAALRPRDADETGEKDRAGETSGTGETDRIGDATADGTGGSGTARLTPR